MKLEKLSSPLMHKDKKKLKKKKKKKIEQLLHYQGWKTETVPVKVMVICQSNIPQLQTVKTKGQSTREFLGSLMLMVRLLSDIVNWWA